MHWMGRRASLGIVPLLVPVRSLVETVCFNGPLYPEIIWDFFARHPRDGSAPSDGQPRIMLIGSDPLRRVEVIDRAQCDHAALM